MDRRGRGCSQQINTTPTAKPGTGTQMYNIQASKHLVFYPPRPWLLLLSRAGREPRLCDHDESSHKRVQLSASSGAAHIFTSHLHHRPLLLKYFSKLKISPQIWWRVFNQECYRYLTAVPPPWTWYLII